MKVSQNNQGLQKTKYLISSAQDRVELEYKQRAHRGFSATSKRENREFEYGSLERILSRKNLLLAMKRVISNKGSHGVDGMTVYELKQFLQTNWLKIREDIFNNEYKPMPVRRVEIPKPDGGTRLLGIPTVLDRFIQQAIAQELNLIYDENFSENSFGFRPRRGAKDAIKKAESYINEGYKWVVDIDLEKFFDKVNYDILMYKLSKDIKDKRVLKLIRKYLQSGIMINGIAKCKGIVVQLDKWIKQRLRMCIWKQWKKVRTRYKNLKKLGLNHYQAIKFANTRKGYWRVANSAILNTTLTNQFFNDLGLKSLTGQYIKIH